MKNQDLEQISLAEAELLFPGVASDATDELFHNVAAQNMSTILGIKDNKLYLSGWIYDISDVPRCVELFGWNSDEGKWEELSPITDKYPIFSP
jgi:hypothetical protein